MNRQKFHIFVDGQQYIDTITGISEFYPISEAELDCVINDLESLGYKNKILINFLKGQKSLLVKLSEQVANYVSPENKYCINTNISRKIIPLGFESMKSNLLEELQAYLNKAYKILRDYAVWNVRKLYYKDYFFDSHYCPIHEPTMDIFRDYLNENYDNILKKDTDLPSVNDKKNVVFLENGDLKLHVWVELYKGTRQGWWSSQWYTIKNGTNIFNEEMKKAQALRAKWREEAPERFLIQVKKELNQIRLCDANTIMNSLDIVNRILIPLFMLVEKHNIPKQTSAFRKHIYDKYLYDFNLLQEKLIFLNTYRYEEKPNIYIEYLFNRLQNLLVGRNYKFSKQSALKRQIEKTRALKGQKELKEFILNEKQYRHVLKSYAEVA